MATGSCRTNDEVIRAAKDAVRLVGQGLGNLMYRIYSGEVYKKDPKADWTDSDREKIKGTKVFLLGGSICTRGYMGAVIPRVAVRKIARIDAELAAQIRIFTPVLSSEDTGAFGAYYLALPAAAKGKAAEQALRIAASGKMPILPLLDIGGTKINLVLAHFGAEGPTFEPWRSHVFPTPVGPAEPFYKTLAAFIGPIFERIGNSSSAGLIPILAVGQPGRFEDPKGVIGEGTAKGLGPDFPGRNPSSMLEGELRAIGVDIDIYCANDGRCQFLGIGAINRNREPDKWEKIQKNAPVKVAYLGIGTGLGAGYGQIGSDGMVEPYGMVNAFDILVRDEYDDKLTYEFLEAPLPPMPYEYGDLLSGSFFRRFMHDVDLKRHHAGAPLVFLPRSSAKDLSFDQRQLLLANRDDIASPLDAALVNRLLDAETTSVKTEEIVEYQRPSLENKLKETLQTIADELDRTLLSNVRSSQYGEAIEEVVRTKRRGRRVLFMGIGKSHSIGRDLAYIFSNLGINSDSCELTGADSENLTNVREDDLIFLISNSGRSAELLQLVPYLHNKHCRTVALVGYPKSPLARRCDYIVNTHVTHNPNRVPEAPTTSTTSALAAGTAIGIVVSYLFDYDAESFFLDHPNLQSKFDFPVHGVRADALFDHLAKVEDSLRSFAKAIRTLDQNDKDFPSKLISLTKRILVSYQNHRTIFFTGSGSSLRVAEKIAATLTSIGIDAEAVNPAQLPHGDFAHIRQGDLLVFVSFSGRTRHLLHIRKLATDKCLDCAVITSARNSELAKSCAEELQLVAGTGASDNDLVPVPDQKILSSFINLTVGDALAVILAEVIGATTERFAIDGHRGGELGRRQCQIDSDFLKKLGPQRAETIGDTELAALNETLTVHIDREQLKAYVSRITRGGGPPSEVMVFGMGGIGLAYLAPLLSQEGRTVWFVERDEDRIDAMRKRGYSYSVTSAGESRTIGRVSVIRDSETKDILRTALLADTILTAVGVGNVNSLLQVLHDIICLRYQFHIEEPLNILFSENFPVDPDPLAKFRHDLREKLDSSDLQVYFDGFVGLAPAIDESQVPEVPSEVLAKADSITIEPETAPLYVDGRRLCGRSSSAHSAPELGLGEDVVVTNALLPLHMRKLWVHNMAHAMIGYLGYYAGYERVYDAASDSEIETLAKGAMTAIGNELYRRWSFRETRQKTVPEYIEWRWSRYLNRDLNDTIRRLCRQAERKLGRDDRLVGAANYIRKYAVDSDTNRKLVNILIGVAAALQYAADVEGKNQPELRARVLQDLVGIDSALLREAELEFQAFRERRRPKARQATA